MIEVTTSRQERLLEKSACTLHQVEEALGQGDGSLLEGLLYLEQQGLVASPEGNGSFSTKSSGRTTAMTALPSGQTEDSWYGRGMWQVGKQELLENYLEFWYKKKYLARIPVVFLLFLMPLTYGTLFPGILIPMFFGVYYRFSSEKSFLAEFNSVLLRIARSFYEVGQNFVRKGQRKL